MRPRVKSYGLSSTATRSPGRMRMKFFRMRPDTCASTWCLFSSSTLNMAFGRVSTTVAITSIASSFDKPYPDSAGSNAGSVQNSLLRQNCCAFGGHRDRMLEVRAQTSVLRYRRPAVAQHLNIRLARVHHRLDRNHHAFAQLLALTAASIVGNLRIF